MLTEKQRAMVEQIKYMKQGPWVISNVPEHTFYSSRAALAYLVKHLCLLNALEQDTSHILNARIMQSKEIN